MDTQTSRMTAIVALTAVFSLAISFIIIGAISEEIKAELNIDNAQLGSLVLALFLTSVIVQFLIGPMVDKFGHKPLAIVGFLVTGGSMFLLAVAASFQAALFACILLGIGAMCLNTVGNTLIPVVLFGGKDPARASNFGNAFFGTLAIGYKTGISILGVLMILFLLIAAFTRYPQVSTGFEFSMAIKLLGKGPVILAALALFCYISLEISMGTWIKPYMTDVFLRAGSDSAVANAGLVLSFFGVSIMLGRFLTSAIKNLTAIGTMLIATLALVSVVTILLMIYASSSILAIIAVIVMGLAFAPIFPTVVGVTFAQFEPRLYGSIFGIIFAIGLLGGTFVPKIIGNLSGGLTADQFDPQSLFIAVAMAAILFVIALLLRVTAKKA